MAELDEEILPCLEVLLYAVPDAKSLETLGAAAVLGIVCYDHIGVKVRLEALAPATLRVFIRKVLVRHSRVSHKAEDNLVLSHHADAQEHCCNQ